MEEFNSNYSENKSPSTSVYEQSKITEEDEKEKKTNYLNIPEKKEKIEHKRILRGLSCLLPSSSPQFFLSKKTCYVLHFNKNEETERILAMEKITEKRLYSVVVNKQSMIRKSRKEVKF